MNRLTAFVSLTALVAAAWLGHRGLGGKRGDDPWTQVVPGVLRSAGLPAGYALVDGNAALLIDAPRDGQGLDARGVKKIDGVLLTHYHRGSCGAVAQFLKDGVPVRAPKDAAEWLTTDAVKKYWLESLPLRGSRTAYLVDPVGFDGIDCSLADGQKIDWRGWSIQVVATPGHARGHVAFLVRRASLTCDASPEGRAEGKLYAFCGGALASAGKLWAPYTTDWDHWTDAGLTPAAKSLRKLAAQTATVVEEVAFLKSFERFTRQRLGNAPNYRFLAPEQRESNGSKPWSQVSPHLYLTGNTYVLVSKDNACLMIDPWDKRSADQFAKLRGDRNLGPLEVVMFSHAHFDHYDGIYHLPEREKLAVWALDLVAAPIAEPGRWRAPFLDARPVKFDRTPKDGDTLTWREYRIRFQHLPGQSFYTMGVETVIDGKRCFFTADNFFHQDMFSGSGGWMGLNRSWPLYYAQSAKKVLDARPDWVLAEHGGPFEFDAEDFRRRVQWGEACAKAADALSPSGDHRADWNPHRIHIEPVLQTAKPGTTLKWTLVTDNPLPTEESVHVTLSGRGVFPDQSWTLTTPAGQTTRRDFAIRLADRLEPGRRVFAIVARSKDKLDGADAFLAVDVGR